MSEFQMIQKHLEHFDFDDNNETCVQNLCIVHTAYQTGLLSS